jgi:hypothetical protein
MKKWFWIFFVLVSFVSLHSFAHDAKTKVAYRVVRVKVVGMNGEEITGAKISISNTDQKSTFTDEHGFALLQLDAKSSVTLVVDAIGFQPKTLTSQEIAGFSELVLSDL